MVAKTQNFASPILDQFSEIKTKELEQLFATLSKLIYQLNKNDILTVQRTCFACKYYKSDKANHYCNLLNKKLKSIEIRLDCEEFEKAN